LEVHEENIKRYKSKHKWLTYLLTPWWRILFEKLIVTQIVKK
jgi:hypothetical protein